MLKTVYLKLSWQNAKKLILVGGAFCNCLLASDNVTLVKKSDDNLLDREQRIFPIYRDDVFYKYVKGEVFFVIGTSSAGKSSIVRELIGNIPPEKRAAFLISGHDDLIKTLILNTMRKFWEKLNSIPREDLLYCLSSTRIMPQESMEARLKTDAI